MNCTRSTRMTFPRKKRLKSWGLRNSEILCSKRFHSPGKLSAPSICILTYEIGRLSVFYLRIISCSLKGHVNVNNDINNIIVMIIMMIIIKMIIMIIIMMMIIIIMIIIIIMVIMIIVMIVMILSY